MIDSKGKYRRNGKNVYIKQPEYKELSFVSKLWWDRETMKEIGGIFSFPESKWEMFYKKMIYPTDGKNFYCLVYKNNGEAVGEVSFHGYDSATRIARFNIKIHHKYRNNGYAEEAINLLLEYYFLEFGGEMIMDNIPTKAGLKVAKKLGFEEVSSYKGETIVKITKDGFLNNNKGIGKKVAILVYNGINMTEYSMIHDLLNLANKIAEKNIFDIYSIGFDKSILTSNGVTLFINEVELDKPDILMIPGGVNINEEVKKNRPVDYIIGKFNYCDYICANGNSIKFLLECKILDGIFIPEKQVDSDDREDISDNVLLSKSFIDNGKIMLSANWMGQIDLILSMINKVGGRVLAEKVANEIGLSS